MIFTGQISILFFMKNKREMHRYLKDYLGHRKVQEMKKYIQHGRVSTFEHCKNVADLSLSISRILPIKVDRRKLAVGAMLHDFYLYDWHKGDDGSGKLHGFSHAARAYKNAKKYFDIDEDTGHIIRSHMWPLNLTSVPGSKEAWIVCIADKCVSLGETLFRRQ